VVAHRLDRAMAAADVALHFGPAQIEVAIFEAQILSGLLALLDHNWRRRRGVKDLALGDRDLDLAGGQFGIDGPLGAANHLALDGEEELRADGTCDLMRCRVVRRIEDELDDSLAVAEIDEDETAVVASRVDPSEEGDLATGVGAAQRPAVVSTLPR